MKLTVVEVGGCPREGCGLCDPACTRSFYGSWHRIKAGEKADLRPCTVGYYLKPEGMTLGRIPAPGRESD